MACDVSPMVPYLKPDAELGVLEELKCCEFIEKLFQLDELFRQTVSDVLNRSTAMSVIQASILLNFGFSSLLVTRASDSWAVQLVRGDSSRAAHPAVQLSS